MEAFSIKLTVLSPVHIGTGEEYIPTEYVIKDGYLHVINKDAFIDYLMKTKEYDRFLLLCSTSGKAALLKIREFVFDHFKPEFSVYKVRVSREIEENYLKNLSQYAHLKNEVISQLAIQKNARNIVNYQEYIPGSSLKGSLRTAVLSYLSQNKKGEIKKKLQEMKQKNQNKKIKTNLILEQLILQKKTPHDTVSDPFRALKISDLEKQKGQARIDVCYNVKSLRDFKHAKGLPVKLEYLTPGSIFKGKLLINNKLFSETFRKISGLKLTLDKKTIIDACRYHYQNIWEEEKKRFDISATTSKDYQIWAPLPQKLINDNYFFVKLGKHSGAAAVTIEGFRRIDKTKDFQTTTWVINKVAMGWCLLELKEVSNP